MLADRKALSHRTPPWVIVGGAGILGNGCVLLSQAWMRFETRPQRTHSSTTSLGTYTPRGVTLPLPRTNSAGVGKCGPRWSNWIPTEACRRPSTRRLPWVSSLDPTCRFPRNTCVAYQQRRHRVRRPDHDRSG